MQKQSRTKPWIAFILTVICPGLGHFYIRYVQRAVSVVVIFFLFRVISIKNYLDPNGGNHDMVLNLASLVALIIAAIDSYRCAKKSLENQSQPLKSNWPLTLAAALIYAAFMFGIVLWFRSAVAQPFKLPSAAMSPTLLPGDRILVNKQIYRKTQPQRGDVIVFIYPNDRKRDFVKRIVALPNEEVEIKDGGIWINGQKLTEPEILTQIHYYNRGSYGEEGKSNKVPQDNYFVMGDNSISSHDSRYWGFVPRSDIIGKAYKIYDPIERIGPIK